MLIPPAFSSLFPVQGRAAALAELRLLLSRHPGWPQTLHAKLAFDLAALDCHLPNGGLTCGALHEVVPATQAAFPAAFGFIVAVLARFGANFPEAAKNKQTIGFISNLWPASPVQQAFHHIYQLRQRPVDRHSGGK